MKKTLARRLLALLLTLCMVLSCGACGSKNEPQKTDDAPQSESSNNDSAEGDSKQDPVTLKFYCWASEQPDQQRVFDKLNEYFVEKYNTTVDFQFLGGDFSDKVSVVMNSGEEYDAVFTSNWDNDYVTAVSRGAFVDISGMLDNYPALMEVMPESYWQAVTIKGGIYAVPNIQIAARQCGIQVPVEQMEAFGWTREDFNKVESVLDVEEYLKFCKENFGTYFGGINTDTELAQFLGYEYVAGNYSAAVVKIGDPECKVVNLYETPEFKQVCEDIAYLYSEGVVDALGSIDSDYFQTQLAGGKISMRMGGSVKPGDEVETSGNWGVPVAICQGGLGDPYLSTGGIIATMWGISTTSKAPERTLQIIELLLTDPYVMNLISYGIEGVHYDIVDGLVQMKSDSGYRPGVSWAFGNVFLTTPEVGQSPDVWTETKKINDTATVSPLLGFTFDANNVESEITNITSVVKEYRSILTGEVDVDSTLSTFQEKLDIAGVDTLITEVQAQIDAFLAG